MESIMLSVKFVIMYGLVVFVVAVVGATLIAGLGKLIHDQVRGILGKASKYHTTTLATVPESDETTDDTGEEKGVLEWRMYF